MPTHNKDAIVIVLDVGKSVSRLNGWEKKSFFQQARDCVSWILQRKIISQSKDVMSLLLIGSEESNNRISVSGYNNINCKFEFQLASWEMLKYIENEIETTENSSDWIGALVVSLEMLKIFEEFNAVENKKIVFFSDFTYPASDDIDIIVRSIKALNVEITIIGPDHIYFLSECEIEPFPKRKKTEKSLERQQGEKLVYEFWKKMSCEIKKFFSKFLKSIVMIGKRSGKKFFCFTWQSTKPDDYNKLPENIGICTFESALKQLCSYTRKSCRVTPWNCILDIGDVKINISMYKKTDPKSAKKFNIKCLKPNDETNQSTSSQPTIGETSQTIRDKVMHYKHTTGDGGEFLDVEVKPEDTVEGYRYGTTIIPFTEEDKTVLEYKSGQKSFSIIGFTSISSVPYYILSGDCSYIVAPRDKDENAEMALSAVIQAMKKLECLGIARRVYSVNRGLSLGILYPIIEEIICDETDEIYQKEYLLFVELAFKEEIKSVKFSSLEQIAKGINDKQLEAVDKLIDGMNLMNAEKGLRGEPAEAFDLSNLHDYKEQFFQYCVIQRGLHSEQPLPTALPPYIEKFIKQPKQVEEQSADLIKDIKKLFKVEFVRDKEVNENNEKKTNSNFEDDSDTNLDLLEHFTESKINEETHSINRDWMTLFSKGFPTDCQLEEFLTEHQDKEEIEDFEILKSFRNIIITVRRMYLKSNPSMYNSWLVSLKSKCAEKNGILSEVWRLLVSENLGLISKKENKYSNVSEEEAEEFLCEDITNTVPSLSFQNKENDFKSLPEAINELEAEQMAVDSFF